MRNRRFGLDSMTEVEDQAPARVIFQNVIDRTIQCSAACDQHQRIEIALNCNAALHAFLDQRGLCGPIDTDAIDTGAFNKMR